MSRLEELINELCPEGVKYKAMSEFGTMIRGSGLQKKDFTEQGVGCIHYGQIYTYYGTYTSETKSFVSGELAQKLKKVNKGDLVIAVTSENVEDVCKCVAWLGEDEIVTGGHSAIFKHNQNPKYLSYYFQTDEFFKQKKKIANGTKVIEVSPNKLQNIKIPLPPLEIQHEIVRILDNFTELTAELTEKLTTELTARKKQYEYYRDELFGRNYEEMIKRCKKNNIPILSLEEIGTFTRGKRFVRTDIKENGIPCIHYGDLYTYYGISSSKAKCYLDEELAKKMRFAEKGDVVIVQAGENNMDIGIGVAWMSDEKVAIHDACYIFKHKCNPKYISHYLRTSIYHLQIKKYVSEGKICSISAKGIGKALIPVPSLEEQERIVSILDRFDKLYNAALKELPAEIEARKKQYEYYRDKLLTFKELKKEGI